MKFSAFWRIWSLSIFFRRASNQLHRPIDLRLLPFGLWLSHQRDISHDWRCVEKMKKTAALRRGKMKHERNFQNFKLSWRGLYYHLYHIAGDSCTYIVVVCWCGRTPKLQPLRHSLYVFCMPIFKCSKDAFQSLKVDSKAHRMWRLRRKTASLELFSDS